MDEWMLNDLLECSVCLERLDTSSKVLPCQHTFCKKCLEEIVESHKELRCPECRVLVDVGIDELPPNVLLMRILEGMKNAPKKRGSGVSRGHGTSSAPVHQHGVSHHQAHLTHQHQQQLQQQAHHHHSSPAHTPVAKPSHDHSSTKQAILPGQPCARALYSYTSPESGDLTFKKGDLILLKKKIDANWFHGECSGNRGVFPSVYVEVLTPLPSPVPQCKALYDFRMTTDEEEGCLTFSKGEVINVIRRVDENWAEGKLGDRIGIFPLAFVELNQVARALMKLSTNSQPGPSRVAPPTPTSEETTPLIPIVEHHAAATAAQPATATTTQAPAAVAPRVLHRLGNSASSSSQTPSSSTTPNSSSTSCSSPSSTAPSSPASPPPQQGDHPPLPHPRGTSSTSPLAQVPQQQQHREKRHSLNLLHAANPANLHRLSGEIPQHMDLAGATAAEHPTVAVQPGSGRNHRHRRSVSDQPAAAQSGATASTTTSTAYAAASVLPALYVAMYPYKPQKADELELKKGALYLVTEKCQDGWFKGTAQGSHKSGVFPGNYVALAKSQSHGTASAGAGGGSRGGGGGVPRSNGHGSSWNKPFNGGSSGAQQGRQSKGSGSHGNSSERPYMDLARSMLAAAQAAMHTVTTSQATASPVVSKPSVSTSGQLLSTPPELPPRAASPNSGSAAAAAPSISTSWHAQPASAASPSVGAELSPATPLGRSQSHSMVSTSVTPPPNVTVLVPASQPRAAVDKTKEKKSSSSGLIRRLTTMKKCKSPPPTTYSMDNPVFEDGTCGIVSASSSTESTAAIQPLHARSGSCPSQLLQPVPCAESSTVLCESTPTSRQHLHPPQMSGAAAVAATHSAGSQRLKHKERANLIMANPAAALGSSGARPSPLNVGTSSESGASPALTANHRKSSSLDASSTDMGKKPRQLFPVVKERFRCIVPYPPNSEYELALQVGDVIHVHKKRDDGWYKGTQERTGRTGLFPASFVEAL